LPDRPPDDDGGEISPYSLPSEYGPAHPPGRDDEFDHDEGYPTVTVHDRDAEIAVEIRPTNDVVAEPAPVVAAEPGADELAAAPVVPMSRRELREQREREREAAKRTRPGRSRRSKRTKWVRRGVAVAIVLLLVPVAISYVDYLDKPGSDTVSARTVEWIRDHGGNGIVNTVERWWYSNNPPVTGGEPAAIEVLGTVSAGAGTTVTTGPSSAPSTTAQLRSLPPPTARVPTPASEVEPNEGVWQPTGRSVLGQPAVYTTYVRPDAVHTSYYTGLMWLDTELLTTNYVVGLEEPGGGPNPWGSQIPESEHDAAVAAFNSGVAIDTAGGGAYLDGEEIVSLRDGAASLVAMQDGSADVGVWGRDFDLESRVEAVRQNLVLIVDRGRLSPELFDDDTTAFGDAIGNDVHIWRSGVGVTSDGALVYAGGPALSLVALARTLRAAGAVRAMELDITTDQVSAFTYQPDPTESGNAIEGVKLLDDMTHDGSQYLEPSSRDFFAFTAADD
jgi:hypothetical protein